MHRYLGAAAGALMLMWFASGIVMLFVAYPALLESDRVRMIEPIAWQACCQLPSVAWTPDQPIERAEVEDVAGTPVLRFALPGEQWTAGSLDASRALNPLDPAHAKSTAMAAAQRLGVGPSTLLTRETIDFDQWTVSGEYRGDRPLYRFKFRDPAGTQIYISSRSGRVVLLTTGRQRFWNWLGAVPHWLYPTILRSHPRRWTQVVIWTSVVGGFLTLLGLYLGIAQYRVRGTHWLSPYRGIWNWHHSLGLLFGVFSLTWVVSGLISMNPWGLLEGGDGVEPLPQGRDITWGAIGASLSRIVANPTGLNAVTLRMTPLAGKLYWMATSQSGDVVRLDADGRVAPMTDPELQMAVRLAAGHFGESSVTLLRSEDAYYYRRRNPVLLPVLRVIANDPDHTRLYLDPRSGQVLEQFDGAGRWQRWLFEGLHRLDFLPLLRHSVLWTGVVVALLLGGVGLTATGTYMAIRRVMRDVSRVWN